jgi:peptidoglycan/xylan/chitin deacetylase (PgdA/CDA1 family)
MHSPASGVLRISRLAALVPLAIFLAGCGFTESGRDIPPTPTATHSPLSDADARAARRVAARFLDAFVIGDTDGVWGMLIPEAQRSWLGKQAFDGFLAQKFGSRSLVYEMGEPYSFDGGDSIVVPLAIDFEATGDRVSGPPLLLKRVQNSLLVGDAGPLGAFGPVVGSPQARRPELDVPILIYHRLAPAFPPDPGKASETVTTAAFAEQLAWLTANGYQSITVAELFNAFYHDLLLPPKPVILVFDDGYSDVYEHAFPILRERGFGATIAAITQFVGQPGYVTWEHLREMSSVGFEVISHTATHANLAAMSPEEARRELADSRSLLQKNLERPAQFFVYPYGEPFVKGSEEARQKILGLLQETGYLGALTTSSGPPYMSVQRAAAPYQLNRIPVSSGESVERFAASINANPSPAP